jgi:hypothetical protein
VNGVGAGAGASVGVNGPAAPSAADAAGGAGVSAVADTGGPKTRLAIKRMCPEILANPEDYDDSLTLLCAKATRM